MGEAARFRAVDHSIVSRERTHEQQDDATWCEDATDSIEERIDELNARLEPLKSFVLPGGTELSANLHLARTVSRRAERLTVELATRETVSDHALRYLNRLSDFLFVAGRIANDEGRGDVLWVPGAHR